MHLALLFSVLLRILNIFSTLKRKSVFEANSESERRDQKLRASVGRCHGGRGCEAKRGNAVNGSPVFFALGSASWRGRQKQLRTMRQASAALSSMPCDS